MIYLSAGCSCEKTAQMMASLAESGAYTISEDMRQQMADFVGGFADQQQDKDSIRRVYEDTGYAVSYTHLTLPTIGG